MNKTKWIVFFLLNIVRMQCSELQKVIFFLYTTVRVISVGSVRYFGPFDLPLLGGAGTNYE